MRSKFDLLPEESEELLVETAGDGQLFAHEEDGLDIAFAIEPGGGEAAEVLAEVEIISYTPSRAALRVGFVSRR